MKTNNQQGILYICPTPLGNLEDITLRVLNTLKQVDYIACEDTRVTQKLLNHYDISTKLFSYHKFNEKQKSNKIIELLNQGNNIALVSDAGTPLISDPGAELLKQATEYNIKIVPIPGACALITAISATYLENPLFVFIGFLPKSNTDKENILNRYKDINTVFYESPNRLVKSLEDIKNYIGNCKVTVTRELTKIYEEFKTGEIQEVINYYTNKPPKGEITVIIHATDNNNCQNIDNAQIVEDVKALQKQGFSSKEVSKILSTLKPLSKKEVYNITLSLKKD